MEPQQPTPPAAPPARVRVGWWAWVFLGFFLALAASTAYFALQPVPLSRCLDADRSVLLGLGGETEVRIVVKNVPQDGQLRLRTEPPLEGGLWRILVQWDPGRTEAAGGDERTLTVRLPPVEAVDVIDQRGPVEELLRLHLTPGAR
jgi:hypothetical protein